MPLEMVCSSESFSWSKLIHSITGAAEEAVVLKLKRWQASLMASSVVVVVNTTFFDVHNRAAGGRGVPCALLAVAGSGLAPWMIVVEAHSLGGSEPPLWHTHSNTIGLQATLERRAIHVGMRTKVEQKEKKWVHTVMQRKA